MNIGEYLVPPAAIERAVKEGGDLIGQIEIQVGSFRGQRCRGFHASSLHGCRTRLGQVARAIGQEQSTYDRAPGVMASPIWRCVAPAAKPATAPATSVQRHSQWHRPTSGHTRSIDRGGRLFRRLQKIAVDDPSKGDHVTRRHGIHRRRCDVCQPGNEPMGERRVRLIAACAHIEASRLAQNQRLEFLVNGGDRSAQCVFDRP